MTVTDVQGQVRPDLADLLDRGGQALLRKDWETAGRAAEAVTRQAPKSKEAWSLLCAALTGIGSVDAQKAMAMAMRQFPPSDPFHADLAADRALALANLGQMDEAVVQARQAAALDRLTPHAKRVVATALTIAGLFGEAEGLAEQAALALPDDAQTLLLLGNIDRFMGRLDLARQRYETALAGPCEGVEDHLLAALASLRRWTKDDHPAEAMTKRLQAVPATSEAAARLGYGLFKVLDDLGEPERAWPLLEKASITAGTLSPFSLAARQTVTQTLIKAFPQAAAPRAAPTDQSAPQPILIFGLPRSGTTLVETILSSHSQVQALGETTGLQRAVALASQTPRADPLSAAVMAAAAKTDPDAMAQAYLHYTGYLRDGSPVFTEKLPHNYLYVGHFNRAFPSAPMVHVRRSPMDSLFGTYRLLFGGGAYPWSYSLKDLADNYRLYRQLTDHWRQIMGPRLVEITLEALIDDPEPQIRALLSGCGLAFEAACLTPERSERGVSTASSAQVRKPINRQGLGAWKRYRDPLEPLRVALEADGFVNSEGEAIW
jgi:tetratricopeptide (TPR) repeat protein